MKLLYRAFSWHPWIPGTLKFDLILTVLKCDLESTRNKLVAVGETIVSGPAIYGWPFVPGLQEREV